MSCALGENDLEELKQHRILNESRAAAEQITNQSEPVISPPKKKKPSPTKLLRGGCGIATSIGPIQFGMPPETVKDSMNLKLEVPTYYIIPSKKFDTRYGLNVAEFEFPAYYNFFLKRKKVTLICSRADEEALRIVFQETLLGPKDFSNFEEDFHISYPKELIPNMKKELGFFVKNPMNPQEDMTVDTLINFVIFQEPGNIAKLSDQVEVHKKEGFFNVYDQGELLAEIKDFVDINLPKELLLSREKIQNAALYTQENGNQLQTPDPHAVQRKSFQELFLQESDINNDLKFEPPAFGVTVLGGSHGFDPKGSTSGYLLWIDGRGIMIDPPPFSTYTIKKMGIPSFLIDAVFLTHCHADHDAGIFQKILDHTRVELISTRTIINSFLRKYSALCGVSDEDLKDLFIFRPAVIGVPLTLYGAQFRFFYTFHAIPCIGFEVSYQGKSIYFSADTFYDPEKLNELREKGIFTQERCDSLAKVSFDNDLILHEAGVPPIHTPQRVLGKLSEEVKKRMYLVHVAEKDVLTELGLKNAKSGLENTLVLIQEKQKEDNVLRKIDILSTLDLFETITLKNLRNLIGVIKEEEYYENQFVILEGEPADKFYIIVKGLAKIFSYQSKKKFERYIQVGDYFGETSLLPQQSLRQASVMSLSNLKLFSIQKHDFLFIFGEGQEDRAVLNKIKNLVEVRKSDAIQVLFKNQMLTGLKPTQKTHLEMIIKHLRDYEPGSYVWKEGEQCLYAVLVRSGIFNLKLGKKEELIELFTGSYVGEFAAMRNDLPHTTSLRCEVAGSLFLIEKKDLVNYLMKNPGLMMNFSQITYFI